MSVNNSIMRQAYNWSETPSGDGTTAASYPVSEDWAPYGGYIMGSPLANDERATAPPIIYAHAAGIYVPKAVTVAGIRWDNRFGSNYSAGTGGDYNIKLVGAFQDGSPDPATVYAECDASLLTGMASRPQWQDNAFTVPYLVEAFKKYFIYWENVHTDPALNYISINKAILWDNIDNVPNWEADQFRAGWFYKNTHDLWSAPAPDNVLTPEERIVGSLEIYDTNGNGYHGNNGFSSSTYQWLVGGDNCVRWNVSSLEPVSFVSNLVSIRANRPLVGGVPQSNPAGLNIIVRDQDINEVVGGATIPASYFPDVDKLNAGQLPGDPGIDFCQPYQFDFSFIGNRSYSIELACSEGTTYQIDPYICNALRNKSEAQIRAGDTQTGFAVFGDRFINAYAQSSDDGGATWTAFVPGNATDRQDLALPWYWTRNTTAAVPPPDPPSEPGQGDDAGYPELGGNTQYDVFSSGDFDNALNNATDGDHIVIKADISPGSEKVIPAGVVLRANTNQSATFTGGSLRPDNRATIWGLRLNRTTISIGPDVLGIVTNAKLHRLYFDGSGSSSGIPLYIHSGVDTEVRRCEWVNTPERGVTMEPRSGTKGTKIIDCLFRDNTNTPTRNMKPIETGQTVGNNSYGGGDIGSEPDWTRDGNFLIERCMIIRWLVSGDSGTVDESISNKANFGIYRDVVFKDARNTKGTMNQRQGQGCRWERCISDNGNGFNLRGKDNVWIGCRVIGNRNFRIMGGNCAPTGTQSTTPTGPRLPDGDTRPAYAHPQDIKIISCEGPLVDDGYSGNDDWPPVNTRIENHTGSITFNHNFGNGPHTYTISATPSESVGTYNTPTEASTGVNSGNPQT